MFTGLIKTMGEIRRVDQRGDRLFAIAMHEPFALDIGDSVACNGICLTVIKLDGNVFKVSASEATLACSTARAWEHGTRLNLEPALRVGDALGGHFVSGHVDGIGHAVRSDPSGDSTVWEFDAPRSLAKFIAAKGSITIDGVSLTVNEVKDHRNQKSEITGQATEDAASPAGATFGQKFSAEIPGFPPPTSANSFSFTVNIIPHTREVTGFKTLRIGDAVNLEIDLLARYAARLKEAGI